MELVIAAVVAVVLAVASGAICFRLGISHRKRSFGAARSHI